MIFWLFYGVTALVVLALVSMIDEWVRWPQIVMALLWPIAVPVIVLGPPLLTWRRGWRRHNKLGYAPLSASRAMKRLAQPVWDFDTGNASHCVTCGCDLQPEPDPPRLGATSAWDTARCGGRELQPEWAHVSIRCAFCLQVFCQKCSRSHFGPTHVTSPGAAILVEKREAFVVTADGVPLKVTLDQESADADARFFSLHTGHEVGSMCRIGLAADETEVLLGGI